MCSASPGQPALLPAPCAGLPQLQTAHAAQRARVCPVKAPNPHSAQAPKLPRANQAFVNKRRSAKVHTQTESIYKVKNFMKKFNKIL